MAELPPTQYLVMEVLAARTRLGETLWPFPNSVSPALDALEKLGLISTMSGNQPYSRRARLTDAGREHSLKPGYLPPAATCIRCTSVPSAGLCCSAHKAALCHGCYRRTHFVEVCVSDCQNCAAEGLDPAKAVA
jgi:hypothetical protein